MNWRFIFARQDAKAQMAFIVTANSQIEIDKYRWICELAVFLARKDAKAQMAFIVTANSQIEIDEYQWIVNWCVFFAREDAKAQRVFEFSICKLCEICNNFCEFYKSLVFYWKYIYG